MHVKLFAVLSCAVWATLLPAGTRHAGNPVYPTYDRLVMAGYQGWFHNRTGGTMFRDEDSVRLDMWPDVSEYEKTYPTGLKLPNGETARFFCSDDESTVETHFRWMEEYGLDGVFFQRFFNNATRPTPEGREASVTVLRHGLKAAQKHGRAVSVMYDLSGLKPGRDDCLKLVDDWKFLVDEVKVTSFGERNLYLHHRAKPLVVIWGVGFPDRPYRLGSIKLEEFIDFLRNDPVYGGCSVMLGVPTCWRTLEYDCVNDPYLHTLIRKADLVLPWMVQRFTPLLHFEMDRYRDTIRKDIAWCDAAGVDYVPLVFPGFSWHNLSRHEKGIGGVKPVASIPRMGGRFYWDQIQTAVTAGAKRLYVAMFDEVNEGTAIFKVTDAPPVGKTVTFADMDGQPTDHYLFLTGEGAKLLRGERRTTPPGELPRRTFTYRGNPFATHRYFADPSAHVWNGRLYVYPSQDIVPPRGCDLMDRYHVLSTDNMIDWVDHGEFMRASDVPWGRPEGGFMWAPDCAFKDGKYYFYFPHPSLSRWNDSWLIGVAVSSRPDGGFKNVGTIPGLGGFAMIDPCVFTDKDGQSYIYAGGGAKMVGAKLKPNMVELDGEAQPMEGLEDFHEGPWVFRRGDWYYLMYPDNVDGANRQHYCMSKKPLGPWEHKGVILEATGCDTSHGSIVEYKGQWYMFYHNCVLSGRGNLRTICYDKLSFNDDGTIRPVVQTLRERQPFWKGK